MQEVVRVPKSLYYGTNDSELAAIGIGEGNILMESESDASMYGKYIYEITLPEDHSLIFGEDSHQFETLSDIMPEFIKLKCQRPDE